MNDTDTKKPAGLLRHVARGLSLLWAGVWLIFGLLSGAGEGARGLLANAPNALPGVVFLASALLAWWRPYAGAVILLIEGVTLLVGYPLLIRGRFPSSMVMLVLGVIALPPILAGLLFLLSRSRTSGGGTAKRAP